MWTANLRKVYGSYESWRLHANVYGLTPRLGFDTARAAWDANPVIQGSTNPVDFKIVVDNHECVG